MTTYICPKCGKEYRRGGKYYEDHVSKCIGKDTLSVAKKKITLKKEIKDSTNILTRLENLERRVNSLEKNFKSINFDKSAKYTSVKKGIILPLNDDLKLTEIIKKIVEENSDLYSIKGVIPLGDLKRVLSENYNLSKKKFEGIVLRLYRRELIDLQAGGTLNGYFLKSPTGKRFFYLMVKEI